VIIMRLWVVPLVLALTTAAAPAPTELVKAVRAHDFLESLGIGVHMGYTDGAYVNVVEAIADLNYLGIHQLRDATPDPEGGIPNAHYRSAITALADAGNRFVFIVSGGLPITTSIAQIGMIEATKPGAVIAIDGPNEINNWPVTYAGLTGDPAGRAFQRDLYAAAKADKSLSHLPVYYFTGGTKVDLRAQRGLADYANAHPYLYRGEVPGPRIASAFDDLFAMPYPRVITETGYYDQPQNPTGGGVDHPTQAKLTLDLLMSAFEQGVSKTFLYQLRTAYPDLKRDNADTEYGLFDLSNSPKPVATAIHNLTTILKDTGKTAAEFMPGGLRYALTGLPPTAKTMLFQRSDGGFTLAIWAEPPIWAESSHSPVVAPTTTVTVSFDPAAKSLAVFDPLIGSSPIQTYDHARVIKVAISDHPVMVRVMAQP
jgi:hypothetical protein